MATPPVKFAPGSSWKLTLVLLPSFYRVVYNMGKGKEDEYDKLDCD